MKSEWRVCSNPAAGRMQYGVYRLRDIKKTMEGGNMEVMCYFDKKKDAQQKAKELNAHEAETYWRRGNEDE